MTPRRVPLILRPTPIHRLERASEALGRELWMKRDDLTGFALGGNKGRKLEFLAAAWQDEKIDAVVTCGAAHSNFIRQLAVAGQVIGVEIHAAVMVMPFDRAAGRPGSQMPFRSGNWMLSERFGAKLSLFPDDDWEVLYAHMEQIADDLRRQGRRVRVVPVGGSSPLGAYSFIEAAQEIAPETFDAIFFSTSSGSTQVGLATAFRGTKTRVVGIAADPEPEIGADFAQLSAALASQFGLPAIAKEEFEIHFDYVGPGYGVPSDQGQAAFDWLLTQEGIALDPIYSAKAFAGMIDRLRQEPELKKILFWHTGGIPALFNQIS